MPHVPPQWGKQHMLVTTIEGRFGDFESKINVVQRHFTLCQIQHTI